ncbi:MAG: hypothetical protein CMJ20_02180 [Phycisphaeraceae bacterium]|nr:hypothetical protein [Phycisphaeraceae bacterium]
MNWLCVGTGDIVTKRAADALATADESQLVSICGGRGRAQIIANEHNAPQVFSDLDEALAKTTADAVYIGTPVDRHCSEATASIRAGKHVLVEKPLGLSGDDAQAIADQAMQAGVTAGCAYYRRTFPRYEHLRKLIIDGVLGRIVFVRTAYWGWFSPRPDDPKWWRVQKARSGGGPLMDMGSHMFDLLIGLFGLPTSVFAQCETLANDYEVEDSATIAMTMADGIQASAQFGWNSKTWRHELEVVGTEGKVLWLPADMGNVVVTIGRDVQEVDLPNSDNVHQPLVTDFTAAVAEGRSPVCPVHEAVKTNRLIDAIYLSAQSGRTQVPKGI